jgi:hypothetical protein
MQKLLNIFSLGPGVECKEFRKQAADENILAAIAEKKDRKKNVEVSYFVTFCFL